MRYAMRIAETASHQIFERKWRQLNIGMLGSVCVEIIQLNVVERKKIIKLIILSLSH